jgi:hypothetical protein
MVFPKKVKRIRNNIIDIGVDFTMNKILSDIGFVGMTIQHVMAYSPYDVAISIIALKFGIQSKLVLTIIVAFLL